MVEMGSGTQRIDAENAEVGETQQVIIG